MTEFLIGAGAIAAGVLIIIAVVCILISPAGIVVGVACLVWIIGMLCYIVGCMIRIPEYSGPPDWMVWSIFGSLIFLVLAMAGNEY